MANIQLLQGTEKIKDSYTKINTSVTNLNNAKMEKSADSDLNMNGHSIADIAAIDFGARSTLDIENGTITISRTHHRVNTTGGPGDLHTINGGQQGMFLLLSPVTSANPITIRHGVGNIFTNDSLDVLLNNANNIYLLLCTDGSNWTLIGNIGVKRSGDTMTGRLQINNQLYYGTGSPEGNLTASPGSIYQNISGGTGTTIYYKASGTGNTGWVAIA